MRREKRQVILFHKRAGQARSAHTGDTPVMLSILRKCIALFVYAAGLTYASLLVPGSVIAECANLGTPEYCPVLAYGFPLPFIADNQGVSPVGSIGRNPISLLLGEDHILGPQLALSGLFWLLVVVTTRFFWRRWRQRQR